MASAMSGGSFEGAEVALIEEHFLLPESVSARKRKLHQQALGRWAERVGVSPIDAWAVREACIAALSNLSD